MEPVVDVSTITSRFNGNLTGLLKRKYFKAYSQVNASFSESIPDLQNWKCQFKWHISGAAGPNGPLSYTQYLNDLRSLRNTGLFIGLFFLF
jgi:hypothetical protein